MYKRRYLNSVALLTRDRIEERRIKSDPNLFCARTKFRSKDSELFLKKKIGLDREHWGRRAQVAKPGSY